MKPVHIMIDNIKYLIADILHDEIDYYLEQRLERRLGNDGRGGEIYNFRLILSDHWEDPQ